ncbi:MAG: hypothetical protein GXN97_06630 [Aquificae bacterium]|jgi:hypothetical protein|nr:hypothetical protein [Aquificota bacterium]
MEAFSSPYQILLLQLEEQIQALRQVVFNLPVDKLPDDDIRNFFRKGIELLLLVGDILTVKEDFEDHPQLEEDLTLSLLEGILISKTLIEKLEKRLPLFLETITVFDEPLMDKLEQILHSLQSSLERSPNSAKLDIDELSYVLREIARTLEATSVNFAKAFNKPL